MSINDTTVKEWDSVKHWYQKETDPVENPDHYVNAGHIECIDYIISNLGPDGATAFCQGNVVKYLHRYKLKNGVRDLEKAQWYLSKLIDLVEEYGE